MLICTKLSFREWALKHVGGRIGKAPESVKDKECQGIRGAAASAPRRAPDEIKSGLEPTFAEFLSEHRSSGTSWLNIIQLTEPHFAMSSSSLQDRYKP